jgi:2,4-dienoyl-CoA reductase-like NADH-dependent reductase (Old Yellow Enzyme family)
MAISGAGLLILEATSVSAGARLSPHDLGLWSDQTEAALAPVVAFCRQHSDVRLGIQLQHAGRKGSVTVAWDGQREIAPEAGGWTMRGADAIAYPGRSVPIRLGREEIAATIADFVAAARRADRLGFDLLELHGAHGYLLHNFLSPLSNRRDDEYGGSPENRMRFVLELFRAVRAAWPAEKPLGIRLSATDWAEGGWTPDDTVTLARCLAALGCDYVTASSGGTVPDQRIPVAPGYQVPFARRIRDEAGLATVAVGLITEPRQAEAILREGRADLIALGRAMLYNPRWPWHAAVELGCEPSFPPQYERAHPAMRGGDFLRPRRQAKGGP